MIEERHYRCTLCEGNGTAKTALEQLKVSVVRAGARRGRRGARAASAPPEPVIDDAAHHRHDCDLTPSPLATRLHDELPRPEPRPVCGRLSTAREVYQKLLVRFVPRPIEAAMRIGEVVARGPERAEPRAVAAPLVKVAAGLFEQLMSGSLETVCLSRRRRPERPAAPGRFFERRRRRARPVPGPHADAPLHFTASLFVRDPRIETFECKLGNY
ncbi:hypothetical protein EVAR_51856_1 [Eumeta japonica]|uniref:Uncharacterized protein n=1 Tax=Eumeta variegata TaxID=151549 RepID=A0A4C1YSI0_EUMVA|nr:hypothetical protein EVAR_51856_1 [Eumeta japonica]